MDDPQFTLMMNQLRQYNAIENEESQLINNKIDELKSQLANYKKIVREPAGDKLRDGNRRILQNESRTIKYHIKTLEKDKEVLLKESESFRKEIQALKLDKFEKITEITSLKVQLKTLEETIYNKLDHKLKNYKRMLKTYKIENENLKIKTLELESELAHVQLANQELTTSNQDLHYENEQLHISLNKLKALTYKTEKRVSTPPRLQQRSCINKRTAVSTSNLIGVRIVGKQSTLKQVCFKVPANSNPENLFHKLCEKYAEKYSLDLDNLDFSNYKGDTISGGLNILNGDIIYVNYRY